MKRTIISWIVGVIFGIICCIAAIAGVFKKLCNSMLIREEIISPIKTGITIALFGSKRVTYTTPSPENLISTQHHTIILMKPFVESKKLSLIVMR